MPYIVHFTGKGFTAPDPSNPNGVKVTATGYVRVPGPRPKRTFDIPWDVLERCKRVFMSGCQIVRYSGDKPGVEHFPVIRLGKEV